MKPKYIMKKPNDMDMVQQIFPDFLRHQIKTSVSLRCLLILNLYQYSVNKMQFDICLSESVFKDYCPVYLLWMVGALWACTVRHIYLETQIIRKWSRVEGVFSSDKLKSVEKKMGIWDLKLVHDIFTVQNFVYIDTVNVSFQQSDFKRKKKSSSYLPLTFA